ncbi:GNAT family acetyltransferase [Mycobacterium sp. KBS0706]|uniref:GNAT family acetyltransferase n=1 Tax=Mycobacterium sp. KBS0706 TaxID=2578109 RepID=UPI00110FA4B7|nr:GNAT family acetyltransferase [Mycobacterium sp. KBS0706]TSD88416.1 GNAT family acetyltransferase [Mycobacterium sp. KBS0706]
MELVSRLAFFLVSVILMLLAAGLTGYAIYSVVTTFQTPHAATDTAMLDVIGYLIIAIAVFDVAKYLLEEEVARGQERRRASEVRKSLTKFISTMIIAVFLEALVVIFKVARDDVNLLLYPTALIVAGTGMMLGLGLFQRLSASVERDIERGTVDDTDDEDGETPRARRRKPSPS